MKITDRQGSPVDCSTENGRPIGASPTRRLPKGTSQASGIATHSTSSGQTNSPVNKTGTDRTLRTKGPADVAHDASGASVMSG